MCEVLKVSSSCFYRWLVTAESPSEQRSSASLSVTSLQKNGAFKNREFGYELLILKGRKTIRKSKVTEAQIAFAIKKSETDTRVEEVCRKMVISEATFYNWKKKYGDLGVSELHKLRQLEEENGS